MSAACCDARMTYPMRNSNSLVAEALDRLGAQLRAGRRTSLLSQRVVDDRTGIDQSTISRLEHGLATRLPLERLGYYLVATRIDLIARPALWVPPIDWTFYRLWMTGIYRPDPTNDR